MHQPETDTARPPVGTWLRILQHEPDSTELTIGDPVRVMEDPDAANPIQLGEPLMWVQDFGGTCWGLDPDGAGVQWEVRDDVDS